MKFNKRHAIIAAVIGTALSITGLKYKEHVDYWAFYEACSEARDTRRDAAALLGKTIMSGMSDLSAQATVLIQDANDIIKQCNARGV